MLTVAVENIRLSTSPDKRSNPMAKARLGAPQEHTRAAGLLEESGAEISAAESCIICRDPAVVAEQRLQLLRAEWVRGGLSDG